MTEDVDNTVNELLKSAHFNMEEQIYIRIKSSSQSSHFILIYSTYEYDINKKTRSLNL